MNTTHPTVFGAALALCIGVLTAGCTPSEDGPTFGTWSTPWSHSDRGYTGTFTDREGCLHVTVEGTDHVAVLPGGSSVEDGTVKTPDDAFALDSEVTVGGAGFPTDEAHEVTQFELPEACGTPQAVWIVT